MTHRPSRSKHTVTIADAINLAIQHHQAGRLTQAETIYRHILQADPNNSSALHLLGVIAAQTEDYATAITLIQRAIAIDSHVPVFYSNLASAFIAHGQFAQAVYQCRQALALEPTHAEALNNLGLALFNLGQLADAITYYRQALMQNPTYIEAQHNLGIAFHQYGAIDDAIACYQQTVKLNPNYYKAYNNLGIAYRDSGKLSESWACYQKALAIHPHYPEAYVGLGNLYKDQARLPEALQCYRQALAIKPTSVMAHDNLLLALHYTDEVTAAAIFAEHQHFGQHQVSAQLAGGKTGTSTPAVFPFLKAFVNDRHPQRCLKIGYVSADFYKHSVAYFIEPLLSQHDHSQFEVYCYYNDAKSDDITARLQQYADHWLNCVGMPDAALAEMIRQAQLDILVDLGGHTNKNRLLTFARKPAPIQVTYLGYPDTTGLTTVDYRLTDHYADPEGVSDQLSTETLVRLPSSYFCYQPYTRSPTVTELPSLKNGVITFGSFNNSAKWSPTALALWAQVLHAVPHSQLLLKANSYLFNDESMRASFIDRFAQLGIPATRLILRDRLTDTVEHLATYQQVDIGVDSYPYNGATTTCEALWMGVPVVTLVGTTHAARTGLSILTAAGLSELVAWTPAEYVAICVKLAADPEYLQALRRDLRSRLQASPLLDAVTLTREVEAQYRQMWVKWCGR